MLSTKLRHWLKRVNGVLREAAARYTTVGIENFFCHGMRCILCFRRESVRASRQMGILVRVRAHACGLIMHFHILSNACEQELTLEFGHCLPQPSAVFYNANSLVIRPRSSLCSLNVIEISTSHCSLESCGASAFTYRLQRGPSYW